MGYALNPQRKVFLNCSSLKTPTVVAPVVAFLAVTKSRQKIEMIGFDTLA